MKVYHASKFIIESPDIYHSRDLLDFGKGFYLTSLVEQAKKYAQRFLFQSDKAYLNQYILDENLDREYKIKEFIGYNEEWLDFVALCRTGKQTNKFDMVTGEVKIYGIEYFIICYTTCNHIKLICLFPCSA